MELLPVLAIFFLLHVVGRASGAKECWTCSFSDKTGCGDPFKMDNPGISKKATMEDGWCLKVVHDKNYANLVARGPASGNECTSSGCYRTTRLVNTESRPLREQELVASAAHQQSGAFPIVSSEIPTYKRADPPHDVDWHCCCNEDLCNHAAINSTHRHLAGLILVFLAVLKIY
ncbi:unnamed protein product [Rotaria socialis]|uniref:Protein quiver n=1 Tax=Rotaria socialis TaxID=392032 RepID=A0A818FFM5_9BILA|nr:unnamed protein product [Rotaria socialis]CAF3474430.1 unnamed protein product [Rotaria socialis]CAF3554720.1 unnamed protein product [Rotaria socialis]CAF4392570.1 unnamed protein product [Rotaria socialis]CAF4813562.1 unnamed protein product [Rotaria socialis]